ncbi:MAG: bifunctional 3,4-dihydroxy-2-butanone-4-phosphate synthase/GTP cyclohydrolase II, partial [Gammaproteobacteria bacterium]
QFHMALVKGTVDSSDPVLVRVHVHNPICDLTGAEHAACGWPLRAALRRVAEEGRGVVVILYYQLRADDLTAQVKSYAEGTQESLGTKHEIKDLRTIGLGSQILADIGVKKMRILSSPKRIHSLSGFGLEVVEYVS